MENRKIKIGITHGDINGIGYEIILKAFADPTMFEFCTPVVYGSPKVATYHRKAIDIDTNFSIISHAKEAESERLNILPCVDDELKVEMGRPSSEAGRASLDALRKALSDYQEGLIDVLVTCPINNHTAQCDDYHFTDQSAYIEIEAGEGEHSLTIFVKDELKVALVTDRIPFKDIAGYLSIELLKEKLLLFQHSLQEDFGINNPRIAVLALNSYVGQEVIAESEEQEIIVPAMQEVAKEGVMSFGPYAVGGLMGSGNYTHFDGILAMYYDQGVAPFKAWVGNDGVKYTAGLPIVHTSTTHGVAYDIAGLGQADESSLREAIYTAIDVYRRRMKELEIHANPLKKQYFDKRDDSYKLKLDGPDEENSTL